jgi:hypothetical protein
MVTSIPAAPSSTGSAAYRRSPRARKQGDSINAVHIIKYMGRFIARSGSCQCNARDRSMELIR